MIQAGLNINQLRLIKVDTEIISIDYNNEKSVKVAEKLKSRYENMGYTLHQTKQIGINQFHLIYKGVA